jgi:hypothetical protein
MTADAIDAVDVSVYTVPTDTPEGDGTLTWIPPLWSWPRSEPGIAGGSAGRTDRAPAPA